MVNRLIYADSNMEDIRALEDFELDIAYGRDENDFKLTLPASSELLKARDYIYVDGSVHGGVIAGIELDTKTSRVSYLGQHWLGMLAERIVMPNSGSNYLILSGDANVIIGTLLSRIGLSGVMTACAEPSGITFTNYQFNLYIDAKEAIETMLASKGYRLSIKWIGIGVELSAEPIHNYATDDYFDSSRVPFHLKETSRRLNHLICLGQGELAARQQVHWYADTSGKVTNKQTQFGVDLVEDKYDYSSVESLAKLQEEGKKKLEEAQDTDTIKIDLADIGEFELGDIIGAQDRETGLTVAATINKKIVNMTDTEYAIEYDCGS